MNRIVKRGLVLAGLSMVFPVGYLCSYQAGFVQAFPEWGMYLWPTGVLLLATEGTTEGGEGSALFVAQVIAASLASNAVLWVLAGLFVLWLLDSWRAK